MKLKSLTDTFLITNTPYNKEAEEFDRHVLDHQYSLHLWRWRVWQTRSCSPTLPPIMKLNCLTDTFFITNTPSINEAEILTDTFLITNKTSTEETEEFDRHVLHHQYNIHWWSWRVWQTRSWSPILPPLKKLKSLTDKSFITNTPPVEETVKFGRHVLITNTPSIEEAEEFARHVLDHQYSLH